MTAYQQDRYLRSEASKFARRKYGNDRNLNEGSLRRAIEIHFPSQFYAVEEIVSEVKKYRELNQIGK